LIGLIGTAEAVPFQNNNKNGAKASFSAACEVVPFHKAFFPLSFQQPPNSILLWPPLPGIAFMEAVLYWGPLICGRGLALLPG